MRAGPLARDLLLEREMKSVYGRAKRKPVDGSMREAVKCHAQACGFVAFVFDVHPDVVAKAVAATGETD